MQEVHRDGVPPRFGRRVVLVPGSPDGTPQSIQDRFLADEEPLTDAVSMVRVNHLRQGGGPVMVKNRFAPLIQDADAIQAVSSQHDEHEVGSCVDGEGVVPSAVLSTVPASSRAVRRLVLMSSQATGVSSQAAGVLGGEPTNTPTVLVIDMTEADSVRDENWDGTFGESDSDTVSVESLVGSAVEVPQSGDEVMSDPDPEFIEAHSSVAVQLALSTLDEVDLTRIFRLRASVMKTIPSFLRGPFRTALRMAMTEGA